MLILDRAAVAALLPMAECIDVMARALETLARGGAVLPLRSVLRLPDGRGALYAMPAYLDAPPAIGIKALTVFPGNHGTEYESHQGAVLLFDAAHGRLLALMDAGAVTAIRTAAVSGVATRLLAREDAGDLALLGTGVQAATHLEAMRAVRRIRRVRAWGRTPAHAAAFARRMAQRFGVEVEPAPSARAAVSGADIVCTITAAAEPVLLGEWLAPGAHVNAVGASAPTARELDTAAVRRARLFVDRRESALAEAGDLLIPLREGAVRDDHIRAELGDLLLGRARGRDAPDDITLFKSLGLAIEDVAAAHHVYARAVERGMGVRVELE